MIVGLLYPGLIGSSGTAFWKNQIPSINPSDKDLKEQEKSFRTSSFKPSSTF
jgi:hypothetical protein